MIFCSPVLLWYTQLKSKTLQLLSGRRALLRFTATLACTASSPGNLQTTIYCYCLLTVGHAQGDTGRIIITTLLLLIPNDIQIVATTATFFTDDFLWMLHIQWALPCQLQIYFSNKRSKYIVERLYYSMFHQSLHSMLNRCNE